MTKDQPVNNFLFINHFGQLIQITDKPEIVNGWKRKVNSRFIEALILFWVNTVEFATAKNEFRGL